MSDLFHKMDYFIRFLVDHGTDVYWARDPTYQKQLYVSKAYETVWGRTTESLYLAPNKWEDFLLAEDKQRLADNFANRNTTVQPGEHYFEWYRIIRPDDSIRCITDHSYAIFDNQQKTLLGFAGVARDITNSNIIKSEKDQYEIVYSSYRKKPYIQLVSGVTISFSEMLCLYHLIRGKTAREIGELRYISRRTVESHIEKLREKLDCSTKSELIQFAFDNNLHSICPTDFSIADES